jgi:hypothetical protein
VIIPAGIVVGFVGLHVAWLTRNGVMGICAGAYAMKITIEVSDELYRRAKVEAALRGRKLQDLVAEGLRLLLETPHRTHRRQSLAALMKGAREAVDSGIPDLASNPEYLKGFGRDGRRNR